MLAHHPATDSTAYGMLSAIIIYILLIPSVFTRLKHILCDLDWAEELTETYKNIPNVYRKSFWLLFGLINLAFLFHTINFMWGNTDWSAVRTSVDIDESL